MGLSLAIGQCGPLGPGARLDALYQGLPLSSSSSYVCVSSKVEARGCRLCLSFSASSSSSTRCSASAANGSALTARYGWYGNYAQDMLSDPTLAHQVRVVCLLFPFILPRLLRFLFLLGHLGEHRDITSLSIPLLYQLHLGKSVHTSSSRGFGNNQNVNL